MSVDTAPPVASRTYLQRLYVVRAAFAVVWAGAFFAAGSSLSAAAVTLLVLYPAFDLAAAVVDARRAPRTAALYVNMVVSAAAAVALAVASAGDLHDVIRVWGVWAIVAGLPQLVVALVRRRLGGQWPLILAGGLSVVVGASFLASAGDATSMKNLAGYAVAGAVFFLVSALRLRPGRRVDAEAV